MSGRLQVALACGMCILFLVSCQRSPASVGDRGSHKGLEYQIVELAIGGVVTQTEGSSPEYHGKLLTYHVVVEGAAEAATEENITSVCKLIRAKASRAKPKAIVVLCALNTEQVSRCEELLDMKRLDQFTALSKTTLATAGLTWVKGLDDEVSSRSLYEVASGFNSSYNWNEPLKRIAGKYRDLVPFE